ncbi:GNAT family N-acetyltransferase [Sphingorhabdus arenilitoris]|uniref:GNAT family N-acetyltransferase n=1 Tax=Sphingorhabdus arenilitoris TaxID=1490041 RepID=A0ABV8RI93_9SPHN
MIYTAPRLETERLILRGHERADFEAIFEMGQDAERTQYKGGPITVRSLAWEKFLRGPAMWALLGYGMWIVERRSDGTVLGQVGYADFMRDMDPPLADIPEMAWVLGRAASGPVGQGLGYGSEALAAALQWGDAHMSARAYQCIISDGNIPSIRLAQKYGFQEIRRTLYKESETIVLERPRPASPPSSPTAKIYSAS